MRDARFVNGRGRTLIARGEEPRISLMGHGWHWDERSRDERNGEPRSIRGGVSDGATAPVK